MDAAHLQHCQELIGYPFRDPALLEVALTHASVASTRLQSNERMEFLGDSVLGLVVVHELYDRYGELLEGEMTKIKSLVVSRRTCSAIIEEAGLGNVMDLGKGMPMGDKLPPSVTAAVFESIVGAIYLDGGLDPARRFILRWMSAHIEDAFATEHQRNFKSLLQQYAQRRWGSTPEYHLLDEKGPDHSKCFEIAVSVAGRHFTSAWGMNKKDAEQAAALKALQELGRIEGDGEPPAHRESAQKDAPVP